MASNFADSFSVRVTRFSPKGAKLHAQSAFIGYVDVVVERTDDSADFADLVKGAFIQVDENTIAMSNIALRITSTRKLYLAVPEVKKGEKSLPLFRPASADARSFLTEEIFADEAVAEVAEQLDRAMDSRSEQPAPRQERAPQAQTNDLHAQVATLTALVSKLTSLVTGEAEQEDSCSESELPY